MLRSERIPLGGYVYRVPNRAEGRLRVFRGPGHHAFSLIELLVVIAIIGVLTAILVVALQGAKKQAQDIKDRSDLRQQYIAQRVNDSDR